MSTSNKNEAIAAIKEAMAKLNLTQEELAGILGRAQPTISEMLRGNRSISPEIAIDLEDALHGEICASQLLEWQAQFHLQQARRESGGGDIRLKSRIRTEFPINEMEKRGWIPKVDDVNDKLKAVLAFANNSPDLDNIIPAFECQALARQSATLGYFSPSSIASRAWQYRVRALAEMTPVREFDHATFVAKGLPELRTLVRSVKGVAQVPQVLAKYGIRFVIVEGLSGAKLDGAAMWLDSAAKTMPVIALTLRFNRIDSFWFNLSHELEHIERLHLFSVDDSDDPESGLKEIEDQANEGGAEWLIPQARLDSFIQRNGGRISAAHIQAFAEMVDVHPGVLVGMLQHKGAIPYSRFADMKVDIKKFALLAAMADGFGLPVAMKNQNQ